MWTQTSVAYGVARPQWVLKIIKTRSHLAYLGFHSTEEDQIHNRFAPSQWETALLCNDVSHWMGAGLESAQYMLYILYSTVNTMPAVLMPWRLKEPRHQQAWYWPNKPEYSISSIRRDNVHDDDLFWVLGCLLPHYTSSSFTNLNFANSCLKYFHWHKLHFLNYDFSTHKHKLSAKHFIN